MFHSALSVYDYLSTSTQNTRETADIGVQTTDLGMEVMTELPGLNTKIPEP